MSSCCISIYAAAPHIISNNYYSINITSRSVRLPRLERAQKTGLDSIFPVNEVIYLSTTEHCNVVHMMCATTTT